MHRASAYSSVASSLQRCRHWLRNYRKQKGRKAERQKLGERDFVEATEDEHVTTDVGVP